MRWRRHVPGMRPLGFLLAWCITVHAGLKTDVAFTGSAGGSLTLDAWIPEGRGPFPACILVHGGGFVKGDKRRNFLPLFDPLSEAGFAWFTISYRLAPQHRYPACVEDVETAIRWVKSRASETGVDPERIALIGESAGGHLVSLAGARAAPDARVAAVVAFYAPHDLELQAARGARVPVWAGALFGFGELDDAAREILRGASPINRIRAGMPAYLLIHGAGDDKVPIEQSSRFQERMRAAGNVCDLIVVEAGGHGMRTWENLPGDPKGQMIAWLKRILKAGG